MAVNKLDELGFRYQGHLGAHLIVGGVDAKGPQLVQTHGGYSFAFPWHTMGSGSLAAHGILETKFKEGMNEEEAKAVCMEAIEAGIYHDEGSGSNVDICVIKKTKTTMYRNLKTDNKKIFSKPGGYKFDPDNVVVLKTYENKIKVEDGE